MIRIALGVEYNGSAFYGWQRQENLPTIQGALEDALAKIADAPIEIFCAGRTDAGVHASAQVVHFDVAEARPLLAWTRGVNSNLPKNISSRWSMVVDEHFHARFSALSRRYRYIIFNDPLPSALLHNQVTWERRWLDVAKMQKALPYFLGEKDFSSFRSAQCESKTPMRNVQEALIFRKENLVIFEIQANAFLHHMVRNIMGVLIEIGTGNQPPEWAEAVLQAKDRKAAAKTADPSGLYLSRVNYPLQYLFPEVHNSILLL